MGIVDSSARSLAARTIPTPAILLHRALVLLWNYIHKISSEGISSLSRSALNWWNWSGYISGISLDAIHRTVYSTLVASLYLRHLRRFCCVHGLKICLLFGSYLLTQSEELSHYGVLVQIQISCFHALLCLPFLFLPTPLAGYIFLPSCLFPFRIIIWGHILLVFSVWFLRLVAFLKGLYIFHSYPCFFFVFLFTFFQDLQPCINIGLTTLFATLVFIPLGICFFSPKI